MIFLCFSVKDRVPLINNFYQYLSNFGFNIWYDRRNIFLGDERYKTNISLGSNNPNVKYAIVFYSTNFANGNICLQEFKTLEARYKNNELFLFPVFIDNVPKFINKKFSILKKLVYKEIHDQKDFFPLCLHIIAKITYDEIQTTEYNSINDLISKNKYKNSLYIKLLLEYENIEKTNFNMRSSFLFATFLCLTYMKESKYFHSKTMFFIFHQNCLKNIIDEKRELQIMENIIIYEFANL